MRKIDYGQITTGHAMPYKGGTFEHLIQGVQEVATWAPFAAMPNIDLSPGNVNLIGGMQAFFGITLPGAVLYDGHGQIVPIYGGGTQDLSAMYTLDDGSLTGPEMLMFTGAVGVVPTTPIWLVPGVFPGNGVNADPVTFSDGIQHWVHKTRYIQIQTVPTIPSNGGPAYQIGTFASMILAYQNPGTPFYISNTQIPAINTSISNSNTNISHIINGVPAVGVDNLTTITNELTAIDGPWTAYTPTITGGNLSNIVPGAGSIARYKILGGTTNAKTLVVEFNFQADSGDGTSIFVSLPASKTWGSLFNGNGIGSWYDNGTIGAMILQAQPNSNEIILYHSDSSGNAGTGYQGTIIGEIN